jgi:hypothetical protein
VEHFLLPSASGREVFQDVFCQTNLECSDGILRRVLVQPIVDEKVGETVGVIFESTVSWETHTVDGKPARCKLCADDLALGLCRVQAEKVFLLFVGMYQCDGGRLVDPFNVQQTDQGYRVDGQAFHGRIEKVFHGMCVCVSSLTSRFLS